MDAKLKHLELIQAVIARMASNSFLFKGWAVTIASALAAFAAVDSRRALLVIALASSAVFWGLDAYYLWLERAFIDLYNRVAEMEPDSINFKMPIDKSHAFSRWLKTLIRPHLLAFYGLIVVIEIVGIFMIAAKSGGKS